MAWYHTCISPSEQLGSSSVEGDHFQGQQSKNLR
jgi:hypothetical protein